MVVICLSVSGTIHVFLSEAFSSRCFLRLLCMIKCVTFISFVAFSIPWICHSTNHIPSWRLSPSKPIKIPSINGWKFILQNHHNTQIHQKIYIWTLLCGNIYALQNLQCCYLHKQQAIHGLSLILARLSITFPFRWYYMFSMSIITWNLNTILRNCDSSYSQKYLTKSFNDPFNRCSTLHTSFEIHAENFMWIRSCYIIRPNLLWHKTERNVQIFYMTNGKHL